MKLISAWLLSLLMLTSTAALAQESADANAVVYYNLTPALIGNLSDEGTRLKYFKADVSLRYSGPEADALVKQHEPLIRHHLVMLFSAQSSESLNAPGGREKLRQEALAQVQQSMTAEEGKAVVQDLLFNNLIIQ